jgi:hypothetical protein
VNEVLNYKLALYFIFFFSLKYYMVFDHSISGPYSILNSHPDDFIRCHYHRIFQAACHEYYHEHVNSNSPNRILFTDTLTWLAYELHETHPSNASARTNVYESGNRLTAHDHRTLTDYLQRKKNVRLPNSLLIKFISRKQRNVKVLKMLHEVETIITKHTNI